MGNFLVSQEQSERTLQKKYGSCKYFPNQHWNLPCISREGQSPSKHQEVSKLHFSKIDSK